MRLDTSRISPTITCTISDIVPYQETTYGMRRENRHFILYINPDAAKVEVVDPPTEGCCSFKASKGGHATELSRSQAVVVYRNALVLRFAITVTKF